MAKGHYEREQERLMRLWAQLEEEELEDQIQLDDDDESLAADELETQIIILTLRKTSMRMFMMKIMMKMVVSTESHILSKKIRSPGRINTIPLEQQYVHTIIRKTVYWICYAREKVIDMKQKQCRSQNRSLRTPALMLWKEKQEPSTTTSGGCSIRALGRAPLLPFHC
nr:unnamed protein product [Callosobruchus chinensis]